MQGGNFISPLFLIRRTLTLHAYDVFLLYTVILLLNGRFIFLI